jgi:hypothetical protein
MRGLAVLIVYMLGLGAIICFGIAGLMALQSSTNPTPSAPVAAVAPHKERVAKPVKQTTQKDAQSNQKRKTVNATRKRREEAPTISSSGWMPTDTQMNRPAPISIHFASSAASYWNRFSAVVGRPRQRWTPST